MVTVFVSTSTFFMLLFYIKLIYTQIFRFELIWYASLRILKHKNVFVFTIMRKNLSQHELKFTEMQYFELVKINFNTVLNKKYFRTFYSSFRFSAELLIYKQCIKIKLVKYQLKFEHSIWNLWNLICNS